MVGSLPSRALGMMVFIGQHLATPDVVCEMFAICLRTSRLLTSADVMAMSVYCRRHCPHLVCAPPLPRPPTPHGQGHTLFVVKIKRTSNEVRHSLLYNYVIARHRAQKSVLKMM